jgi:hypothetical protein
VTSLIFICEAPNPAPFEVIVITGRELADGAAGQVWLGCSFLFEDFKACDGEDPEDGESGSHGCATL